MDHMRFPELWARHRQEDASVSILWKLLDYRKQCIPEDEWTETPGWIKSVTEVWQRLVTQCLEGVDLGRCQHCPTLPGALYSRRPQSWLQALHIPGREKEEKQAF